MRFITKFLLLLVAVTPLLGNHSGMYKSTERLPDLCAVQGRVFSFQLRPEHFSNTSLPSDTLQVFSLGSNKPPKWLEVSKWQLRGLPLEGDTETHNLRLQLAGGRETRILTLDVRPRICPDGAAGLCGPFSPRLEALFAFPSLPPPGDLSPADRLSLASLVSSHLSVSLSEARLTSSSAVLSSDEHQILSKHPPDQDVPPSVPIVSVTLSCDNWGLVSLEALPDSVVLLSLFSPQLPWLRHRRQTNRQPGQIVPIELELINTETVDIPFSSSFSTSVPVTSSVLITSTFHSPSIVTMDTSPFHSPSIATMDTSTYPSPSIVSIDTYTSQSSLVTIDTSTFHSPSISTIDTSTFRSSVTMATSTFQSSLVTMDASTFRSSVTMATSTAITMLSSVMSSYTRMLSSLSSRVTSSVLIPDSSVVTSSDLRSFTPVITSTSMLFSQHFSSHVVTVQSSSVPVLNTSSHAASSLPTVTSRAISTSVSLPVIISSASIPITSSVVSITSTTIPVVSTSLLTRNSSLVPVSSSLVPVSSSLVPVSSSLVPVSSSLVPVSSSLVPVSSSLVPVSSMLVPVRSIRVQTSQLSYFSLPSSSIGTNTSVRLSVTSETLINSTVMLVTSSFFQTVSKSSSLLPNTSQVPVTSSMPPVTSRSVLVTSRSVQITFSSVPITSRSVLVTSRSVPITSRSVPVTSSSVPVTSSSVAITSSMPPVTSRSVPITSSSIPITSSMPPITSSSVPITSRSVPITSRSVPVTSSSVPVTSSSVAITSSMPPVTSRSVPITSSSIPITSSMPPITSSSVPITSRSVPITSRSVPVTSSSVPVTSSSVAITSSMPPVTSRSVPITSSSIPITSSMPPITSSSVPITSRSVPITSSMPPITSSSVPITSSVAMSTSSVSSVTSSAVPSSSVSIPMSTSIVSSSLSSLSSIVPSVSSSISSSISTSISSSMLPTSSDIPGSSTHTTSISSGVIMSSIPVTTPPPVAKITLANPLPLLTPSPGVAYFYDIPNNTFSHPGSEISLSLASLVGELPDWLILSFSEGGHQLVMLPPIDSGGAIFYAALVAAEQSSTASDVISIRPEEFTPPLHSVTVTITTNLSEILAGGISVNLSLSQKIVSVTNSPVRLLSLTKGSTVIAVSFVGSEVTRDCSGILALLAKIQYSNGSYTKEFITAFAPEYKLGGLAVGQGVCFSGGTLPPSPAIPSLSESFSHLVAFLSSSVVAIFLSLLLISVSCILVVCCYRYRRYSGMTPAEKKAFLKRRPVVMDTDWSLPPKARTATILPTDLEHIPEEERWLLGPTIDTQPPPAPPRPPQAPAPPPFQ